MEDSAALVAGIVLAAGRGRRMGQTKQLLPLDGLPLLAHAVRAAEASMLSSVVVVLGHEADEIAASLTLQRARVVRNPRYAEGQSTSLHAGLAALDDTVSAAVILLGDQPHVRTAAINAIVKAYMHARRQTELSPDQQGGVAPLVIIPVYGGGDGHPVLIDRALWPEVLAIRGDEGARSVVRAHSEATMRLPMEDAAPPRDVDTPEDYAALGAE